MQIPTRTRPPPRWSPPPLPGDDMSAYLNSLPNRRTGGVEESFDRGQRRVVTTIRNIFTRYIPGRRRRPPPRSPCQPVMHSDRPWFWTHVVAHPSLHLHQRHPEPYDLPFLRRRKRDVCGAWPEEGGTTVRRVRRRTVAATPHLRQPELLPQN